MIHRTVSLAFTGLILAIFTYTGLTSLTFTPGGKWMPLVVSLIGGVLTFVTFIVEIIGLLRVRREAAALTEEEHAFNYDVKWSLYYFIWLAGLGVIIWLLGFFIGAALWLGSFLRINGKKSWIFIAVSMVSMTGFFLIVRHYLPMDFPPGLIGLG